MDTVLDLLESIDPQATVLVAGDRTYTGKRFAEMVYKTGNYLRHCGVHAGAVVEIYPTGAPETIFGFLGTALLEGVTIFGIESTDSPAVRLGPTEALRTASIPPGCRAVGFGTPPDDPSWAYFEREIWSENPFFPEIELDPERSLLGPDEGRYSSFDLLETATIVAKNLTTEDRVAIRSALDEPGTVTHGILAPLLAGSTILLPEDGQRGDVAVGSPDSPEPRVLEPSDTLEN